MQTMSREAPGLKTWLAARLRRTNWVAAGIAGLFQIGFFAMLILMGVVNVTPAPKRAPPLISITAAWDQQQQPPAPDRPDDTVKPVTPPISQVVMPPPKIVISAAAPVASAPERLPDLPKPAAAAAPAPTAATSPAAAAGPPGPVKVANLTAIMTYGPPPPYPTASKHKKETGTVVVRVVISEQGTVTEASIRQSSGFSALDEAALNAVRRYRFSPTIRDGRAVVASGSIAMPFTLKTS